MDSLQADWKTGRVLRVDILNPIGREFARQHEFVGTPTFVLFDGSGEEIKRWQQPPALNELN